MKAEISIPVALATSAVVVGVYANMLPTNADARSVLPNIHLQGAERTALLTAVGISGAISLIAKDAVPFIIGAGLAVGLSWAHRYANHVDPVSGKLADIPGMADEARRYTAVATG